MATQGRTPPDELGVTAHADPRGHAQRWISLEPTNVTGDKGPDAATLAQGYVSVTPLQLERTNQATFDLLKASLGNVTHDAVQPSEA